MLLVFISIGLLVDIAIATYMIRALVSITIKGYKSRYSSPVIVRKALLLSFISSALTIASAFFMGEMATQNCILFMILKLFASTLLWLIFTMLTIISAVVNW